MSASTTTGQGTNQLAQRLFRAAIGARFSALLRGLRGGAAGGDLRLGELE